MAISFQLNLTPNQIEFLQRLDLYASGAVQNILVATDRFARSFATYVHKLIREGLVVHDDIDARRLPRDEAEAHRYYKITEKGKAVLGLIDDDVQAFMARQKEIKRLRLRAPA